ncbi:tol-pal system protein YbgF [Nitrospinae bacterium AH_259_B05_G02_I21]|nr:tol-pal system protein YbgF [Nitrospinae bacterium AH_259_B05_G02_I21]
MMVRRRNLVLGTIGLGVALTIVAPGRVGAQEDDAASTSLRHELRQVATAVAGMRQDLVVLQRTQAQTKASVEELQTAVQVVDSKLEEINHRLGELAQRLDAIEAGAILRKKPVEPSPPTPITSEPEAAEPPPPAVAAPPPSPGTPPLRETVEVAVLDPREIFRAAHEDYVMGRYDLSILGFRDYLKRYPNTELASSSQYWIGECYLGQRNYAQAVEEFQKLLDVYPQSPKVPSALYKQGLAYLELGREDKALKALETVSSQFPTTTEAGHAAERLKTLTTPQQPR